MGEVPSSPLKKKPRVVEEVKEEEEEEEKSEQEEDDEEEEEQTTCEGHNVMESPDDEEEEEEGSISVTLTDPKVLHCSICLKPFTIPVFQCEKGHAACSSCCNHLDNKCLFCSYPIGYIRCPAIEKVLESVKAHCQNFKYGCNETVSFCEKNEHEKSCLYAPCSCPLPDCNFISSFKRLSRYFSHKHSHSATHFQYNPSVSVSLKFDDKFLVLQEEKNGILFVLNNYSQLYGKYSHS